MLITERTSDGRTVVRLHKDWHPSRIGKAYVPPTKNYVTTHDAQRLQAALLRNKFLTVR